MGANHPITLNFGINPIIKVAEPISNNEIRNDLLRPFLSPIDPKISDPMGRIKNDEATMARVSRNAVESLSGKKLLLSVFANMMARNKSYHSSSVPVADVVMITRMRVLRSFIKDVSRACY